MGASLGGPMKKDQIFLFLNFEGFRDAEAGSAQLVTVPTAAMRDGVISISMRYQADGSLDTFDCPGNIFFWPNRRVPYTAPPGSTRFHRKNHSYGQLRPQVVAPIPGPNPTVISYMIKFMELFPVNDQTTGDLLNTAGYRFRAPTTDKKNWYIAKLDYNITSDAKHRLSISSALANENNAKDPFLPGSPPEHDIVNYNKGIIAGYSAVISSNLINNFRYGFVRQSLGKIGDSNQPWNYLSAFSQGITYSLLSSVP